MKEGKRKAASAEVDTWVYKSNKNHISLAAESRVQTMKNKKWHRHAKKRKRVRRQAADSRRQNRKQDMVAGEDKGRQIPATHLGKPLEATICQSSNSLSLSLALSTPRLKAQNANDKTVPRLSVSGLGQLAQVDRAAAAKLRVLSII